MFSVIRIIIGCCVFVILMILTKKLKQSKRNAISIGISIMLYFALLFLPFENLFVTFDSPEKAYDYYNFGESNVVILVEGENCDLIVDDDEGTLRSSIIPKNNGGWKIGIGLNSRKVVKKFYDGIFIEVVQYRNTGDYFISIENGEKLDISDNYNSNFYFLDYRNDILDENPYRIYYAHITDFDSEYRVTINGVEMVLVKTGDGSLSPTDRRRFSV